MIMQPLKDKNKNHNLNVQVHAREVAQLKDVGVILIAEQIGNIFGQQGKKALNLWKILLMM